MNGKVLGDDGMSDSDPKLIFVSESVEGVDNQSWHNLTILNFRFDPELYAQLIDIVGQPVSQNFLKIGPRQTPNLLLGHATLC